MAHSNQNSIGDNNSSPNRWIEWLIPILLLALALAVRLPTLGEFITADETKWISRSRWFATALLYPEQECPPVEYGRDFSTQGLGCTLQIGYPGVTTMWAGSLGLLTHHWQNGAGDLLAFLEQISLYTVDPEIIGPVRWPVAVMGALFVPSFYLLLRRLFNPAAALLAALLVALHPFQIALARVLHHDSLNTTFMVLSLLALIGYWLRGWGRPWLLFSAVLGGLALLSKQVSWFMPPFVAVLAALTLLYRRPGKTLLQLTGEGLLWGAIAALTFVALFPAMWVMPAEVIGTIFGASAQLAGAGHPHFFLGEITDDPGLLFYPLGWLLRATPLELAGLLGLLPAVVGFIVRRRSIKTWLLAHPVEVALLLFVALLFVFVNLSPKKLVRYFLPAFPVIDIFVAIGLLSLVASAATLFSKFSTVLRRNPTKEVERRSTQISGDDNMKTAKSAFISAHQRPETWSSRTLTLTLVILILLSQGWLVFNHAPYYLTYYNPFLGGAPGAANLITVVGWGEGLDEAAEFLNQQPNIESDRLVAEWVCGMIRPFLTAPVSCLNSSLGGIMRADYVIYYITVIQRHLPWVEQYDYYSRHRQPVHRVTLHGLDYVRIYRNPIQHHVDRAANSLPNLLTTFGYNLTADGDLALFWQKQAAFQPKLRVGLAPTRGVYRPGAAAVTGERQWIACRPRAGFEADATQPNAVIESLCPLGAVIWPPGLYDVKLAFEDESGLKTIESSRLAVLHIDEAQRFEVVELGRYGD